jgi:hypothetical protein
MDARSLLNELKGHELRTLTRRQKNVVIAIERDHALVATDRAPKGQRVLPGPYQGLSGP